MARPKRWKQKGTTKATKTAAAAAPKTKGRKRTGADAVAELHSAPGIPPPKGRKKKGAAAAAKPGATRQPVILRREKRSLPVPVGAEVVDRAAHEMAKLHGTSERLKSERRETMAGFKERRSSIDQRMGELADTVNKSTALTPVWCTVKLYVEENRVDVVREDTAEVVETGAATQADRQADLDVQVAEVKSTSEAVTPFGGAPVPADASPESLAPDGSLARLPVGTPDPVVEALVPEDDDGEDEEDEEPIVPAAEED
jgi:hypothetical protein